MAPLERRRRDGPDDVGEDLRLGIGADARLEAGQEQEVLDDAEQALGLAGDVGDHRRPVASAEPVALVAQQAGVAEDRRDRRSQLVGDEPEELVLDRVRGMQGLGGGPQRVLGALAVGDVDEDVDRADDRPSASRSGVG